MAFRDVLQALRGALREVGMQESPQAQESPQGFTRRHRGYRVVIEEVANTRAYGDRSRAQLRYTLRLMLSHRLRPTPEDGFADVGEAGTDYERIISALMGDQALNALGLLQVARLPVKVSADGEWLEGSLTFSLDVELAWLLDGGEESGS